MALLSLFFQRKSQTVALAVNAASVNWSDDLRTLSGAADIRHGRQTVGQRVAGLYINDPVVRSAVNLMVSQIVGSGIRLAPLIRCLMPALLARALILQRFCQSLLCSVQQPDHGSFVAKF